MAVRTSNAAPGAPIPTCDAFGSSISERDGMKFGTQEVTIFARRPLADQHDAGNDEERAGQAQGGRRFAEQEHGYRSSENLLENSVLSTPGGWGAGFQNII